MAYRNTTKGARAIHFHNGTHVLVEPGATVEADPDKVARLAPGLVYAKGDLPPVPKDVAAKAKKGAGGADELQDLRAEYKAKTGKNAFNGWDAATLREKIGAA